jgi:hypothetical protein
MDLLLRKNEARTHPVERISMNQIATSSRTVLTPVPAIPEGGRVNRLPQRFAFKMTGEVDVLRFNAS